MKKLLISALNMEETMKGLGYIFREYGALICGIFFVGYQIFIYIDHGSYFTTFSGKEITFFLLSSICGILGVLFILGWMFLIKEIDIKKLFNKKHK
jgi:hypothetical protein